MERFITRMPHVAILLLGPNVSHSQILRGILSFTQRRTPWTLDVRVGRTDEPQGFDAASWRYNGIISNHITPEIVRLARRHRTPVILVNDVVSPLLPVARVRCDNASVARMAAEYFAAHDFKHVAYVGVSERLPWVEERRDAFVSEAEARGLSCEVFHEDGKSRLREWLLALQKPCAILAAYDIRARNVIDACVQADISVPDEVVVLGVDNDDVFCETSSPTLSSIAMTTEEAGFHAAEVLDEAMSGRRRVGDGGEPERIPYVAKAVVERRSTAQDATSDALVRRCRALIEANVARHFGVADLARSLFVSRRTLELRFRAATGRTVAEEIVEQRVRRAKALLVQRSMNQAQIAAACGFTDASHMNVVFQRLCGATPGAFR